MEDSELQQRAQAALATYDTTQVFVEVEDGIVRLVGQVTSDDLRRQMGVAVAEVEGVRSVQNDLQVELVAPEGAHLTSHPEMAAEMQAEGGDVVAEGMEMDLNELVGTTDAMEASSEAEPYFPPTDPVVRPAPETDEGFEVVGGFGATSMDAEGAAAGSFSSVDRGDEQLADDVRRELREDSLTTDLEIKVSVRDGVVYLYGKVSTLDDAEAAEEVAARVPGVVEVREQLQVAA